MPKTRHTYTENDLQIIKEYFFDKQTYARQNYDNWCEYIKKLPEYLVHLNSHDFVIGNEDRDNLVTYVLKNIPQRATNGLLHMINKTRPDWNYKDKNGEHCLFFLVRQNLVRKDSINKLIKDLHVDPDIKNKKGEYFTYSYVKKEFWERSNSLALSYSNPQYRGDIVFLEDDRKTSVQPKSSYMINKNEPFLVNIAIDAQDFNYFLDKYPHHFETNKKKADYFYNSWLDTKSALVDCIINTNIENYTKNYVLNYLHQIDQKLHHYHLRASLKDNKSNKKRSKI